MFNVFTGVRVSSDSRISESSMYVSVWVILVEADPENPIAALKADNRAV
jgi:hypothetical protein